MGMPVTLIEHIIESMDNLVYLILGVGQMFLQHDRELYKNL